MQVVIKWTGTEVTNQIYIRKIPDLIPKLVETINTNGCRDFSQSLQTYFRIVTCIVHYYPTLSESTLREVIDLMSYYLVTKLIKLILQFWSKPLKLCFYKIWGFYGYIMAIFWVITIKILKMEAIYFSEMMVPN